MNKLSILALASMSAAAPLVSQTCTGPAASQEFANRNEFAVNFYYDMTNIMFDIDAQVDISMTNMSTWMYDQGVGNPVVPDQVGANSQVDVYQIPTTYVGNEITGPAAPWTLIGSGVLTIAAYPAESEIVFATPVVIPAGQSGIALVFNPTTGGANPGLQLHMLGVSTPAVAVSDQFLTTSGEFIQPTAWTGVGGGGPNIRMEYDVPASAATSTSLGEGCYFRPQGFYEWFPDSPNSPDLANTSQLWIYQPGTPPLDASYIILPGGTPYTPPVSASLTTGATGSSSSASWDDALSTPIQLPFTFDWAGGSTDFITISSNGSIYMDQVVDNSYAICGATYGGIVPFRDGPPRLCPFLVDLDPAAFGGVHYDIVAGNQSVIISWDGCPEWPAAAGITSTFQVILSNGGGIEVVYGNLQNPSPGNVAIAGMSVGNGAPLGLEIDISTAILTGYTTGDNSLPPIISSDSRPVIGSTPILTTSNLTAGTLVGALAVGSAEPLGGPLPLGFLGMPGCTLYTDFLLLITQIADPVSGDFVNPFPIPNNPALQDQQFIFQSAPITPGFNSLGLLSSNGLCWRIGT
jgi:hypothetical protein